MKKIISTLILLNFICSNFAFALQEEIQDELVQFLKPNLKIKKTELNIIKDEFLPKTSRKIQKFEPTIIKDEFLPQTSRKIQKPNLNFNFENCEFLTFYLSPLKSYSTKDSLSVGQEIDFVLTKDIVFNNIKHKKGEIISSRVENISQNDIFGVEASMILGNFKFKNNNQKIDSELNLKGAARTKWIYPTSIVLDIFFGAGIFLYFIRGGHVKLKSNKEYTLKN